ncbi:MAG TPA: right-handed parallel beta-helix repeat-containing protein [Acidimicrobiales bacterium]|nr:right-handed parallel beta-helix repeat-containing protein [Acidimicrobiales bacterium]
MSGKTGARRRALFPVAVLVVALLAACGGGDGDQAVEGGGEGVTVEALDNVFGEEDPHVVRVDPGGTVTWENIGRNDHNIIPVDAARFGVGETEFRPGDTYEATFDEPGAFQYYCSLHGNASDGMVGTVLVGDVEAPPPPPPPPDVLDIVASGTTIEVPEDHGTIQGAVDAAGEGDLILVAPGTYEEAVQVPRGKDGITIRGLDRQGVVLDGEFTRANGIQVVRANGVVIENMTAQNYTKNGFFWTGVTGYRGSYLTAYRNGDYGVYAFESTKGQIDHSYASGSPDAGFYIGGCQPCDALITDVISEWNGLGYSGTNAGGNLVIANSTWRYNRAGIVPNSGSYEPEYPQDDNTIVGNLVHDNNNGETPAIDIAITAMGNGILIAGGINNTIERNRVVEHDLGGIVVITYPESAEYVWEATGNVVRDNVVTGSGLGDLGLWFDSAGQETGGNCFAGNEFGTSAPEGLEDELPCPAPDSADLTEGAFDLGRLATNDGKPESVPYDRADIPDPPDADQPEMPNPATAPARPAVDVPLVLDVAAIEVPAAP